MEMTRCCRWDFPAFLQQINQSISWNEAHLAARATNRLLNRKYHPSMGEIPRGLRADFHRLVDRISGVNVVPIGFCFKKHWNQFLFWVRVCWCLSYLFTPFFLEIWRQWVGLSVGKRGMSVGWDAKRKREPATRIKTPPKRKPIQNMSENQTKHHQNQTTINREEMSEPARHIQMRRPGQFALCRLFNRKWWFNKAKRNGIPWGCLKMLSDDL